MDLTLNPDEEQVVSAVSSFLRKTHSSPLARLATHPTYDSLRPTLAEMGWFGMGVASDLGGSGMTCVDEMLLFREIGRGLGPTLTLPTALAVRLATTSSAHELAQQLLSGAIGACLTIAEGQIEWSETAASGPVRLFDVYPGSIGVLCEHGQASLLDLTGQRLTRLDCLDKSVTMATAFLKQAPVLARVGDACIEQNGQLATAAMLVGIAEAVLAMIVEYAKIRVTFGRPIGSYQAVRHPCADMAVRCEAARAQLFSAAVALRDDAADLPLQLDAAKVIAGATALANVDANIQLHGGIGVMAEHAAHLYMKRAHVLVRWFGSEKPLLDRVVRGYWTSHSSADHDPP